MSPAARIKPTSSRKKWLDWSIAISLLGLAATLAAWFWPFSPTSHIQTKPEIYAVRVQVLDPQGHPIEGAKVRASTGNEPQRTPDGWWEVEIPAAKVPRDGRISIWAEHQAWDVNRVDLSLGDDPNPRAEIRLKELQTKLHSKGKVRQPPARSQSFRKVGIREEMTTDTKSSDNSSSLTQYFCIPNTILASSGNSDHRKECAESAPSDQLPANGSFDMGGSYYSWTVKGIACLCRVGATPTE